MRTLLSASAITLLCVAIALAQPGEGLTKTESFDRDPNWDRFNNRPADRKDQPVTIRQDFGFSPTSNAGGKAGEIGGFIQAAAEPAYYGKVIEPLTLEPPLSASGTLAVADGGTNILLGFFNAGTLNEWRTPNTLALRINGRGDHFFAYLEYCTAKWRAGADNPTAFPRNKDTFPSARKVYRWSITYDPKGNNGDGIITAKIGDHTSVCHLDPGHKADGATFNRFGLLNVMKSADNGSEVYVDDLTINGQVESFDTDPKWDTKNNRSTWETLNIRPRFDFGYSPTQFAGGNKGELGGLIFRGDCRYPDRMAYYADKVGPLTLDKPLRASGKLAMLRGVTDSTVLFGFFNVQSAMRSNPSQRHSLPDGVLGFHIEGPSRDGFLFYPVYRLAGGDGHYARQADMPHVYPDRKVRHWTMEYDPDAANGRGRITLTLDGQSVTLDLAEGDKAQGITFDRFGIITPWIDGNGQTVYFDDLTYTVGQ